MIYRKKLPTKNYKKSFIKVDDFSGAIDDKTNPQIIGYKKAVSLFNFIIKNGKLEQGYGVKPLTLPTSINDSECTLNPAFTFDGSYEGIWLYKYYNQSKQEDSYDLILYGNDGQLYWLGIFDNAPYIFRLYEIKLTSKPTIINYRMYDRNYLLICNETEGMIAWDGDTVPESVVGAPAIRSICKHGTRLFALTKDRFSIRYSSELDPTNWLVSSSEDSSGIIRISDQMGEMHKIVSFLGKLYVIREGGITKINFFEEDDSYDISHVFFSGSKVFADSVVVCGDCIFFATRDGVYSFDGIDAKMVDFGFSNLFVTRTFENSKAVFYKEKYYIACYLNYNDNNSVGDDKYPNECVNNVLIAFDIKNKSYDIFRGVDIVDMLALDVSKISKLLMLTRISNTNKILELTTDGLYDGATFKLWQSPYYTFNISGKNSFIKKFSIQSLYDVDVEIKTENETKDIYVYGKQEVQTFVVNLKANGASVRIRSSEPLSDVRMFKLEYEYEE